MITKKQAKELRQRIARVVKASIDNSWKGGLAPDVRPDIEQELGHAEDSLRDWINHITETES